MRPFAYERPTTLPAAVALLAEHGPDARLLAGGTDLIIRLRDGTIQPRVVVDVKRIVELDDGIREGDGGLTIGARTTMTAIAADPRIRRDFQALAEAAAVVGSVQIRNRATLAGNICNASPAADTAPALLVYGAIVVVAGPAGTRRIPIDEVFVRSGVTTLARGELVTAVELPRPTVPRGSVHVRRTRRRGHDLASVTLACAVTADGVTRLAYGSLGPRPILVSDETGLLADPAAPDAAKIAAPRRPLRRRQPVGDVDARQPRVPPGDAARARAPGGRDRHRAPGRRIGRRSMTSQRIELTVNGRGRSIEVAPHHTLLDVLRDDLGLTGTKECCLVGECGACTVLVDDVAVDSCLMLGVEADGATRDDRRGPGHRRWAPSAPAGVPGHRRRAVRLLHPGPADRGEGAVGRRPPADARRGRGGPGRQPLSLRRLRADHRGRAAGRRSRRRRIREPPLTAATPPRPPAADR